MQKEKGHEGQIGKVEGQARCLKEIVGSGRLRERKMLSGQERRSSRGGGRLRLFTV